MCLVVVKYNQTYFGSVEVMVRIDICDDEPLWIDKARSIIADHFNNKQEITLNFFDNAASLLNVLINKKEYADIVILDIDMPEINGFETARVIKEKYPDVLLMFYTSHEQYVFESFQFQPFRYIRKTCAEQEMHAALSDAEAVIEKNRSSSIMLKTKGGGCLLDPKSIVFFETSGRRLDVHLNDGSVLSVGMTLKELLTKLNSSDFIPVYSGAVANVRYIKNYSGTRLTLENGMQLTVSRGRLRDVKAALMEYWRSRI